MSFEVSIIEVLLFCWAIIATSYAFKYKQNRHNADIFIRALLENKDLRDDLVKDFENFKRSQT